ncbi:MAG: hypothetical protein IH820_10280 [Bacteroidetes bacterium]|nr:hypothetical protein [Bacteroidota bacterium]
MLLQKYGLNVWILSEGGTVVAVMTAVLGYSARAAYKAGRADALQEPEDSPTG